jgi:hypothetical protein
MNKVHCFVLYDFYFNCLHNSANKDFRDDKDSMDGPKNILLLGMIFSKSIDFNEVGQCTRDSIRCQALEDEGFSVFSVDLNKPKETVVYFGVDRHYTGNFSDSARFIRGINEQWNSIKFDFVCLDYYSLPDSDEYSGDRWGGFFKSTLTKFVENHILSDQAEIWLPNFAAIKNLLSICNHNISQYYESELITTKMQNPLYAATDRVADKLAKCKDNASNYVRSRNLDGFIRLVAKAKEQHTSPENKKRRKLTDSPTKETSCCSLNTFSR